MQTKTEKQTAITRRQFVQIAASASIMAASSSLSFAKTATVEVPRRTLGRTGEKVSAIGLGEYHIGISVITETERVRIIRTAIDQLKTPDSFATHH